MVLLQSIFLKATTAEIILKMHAMVLQIRQLEITRDTRGWKYHQKNAQRIDYLKNCP